MLETNHVLLNQVLDLAGPVISWLLQNIQQADSPQLAAVLLQTFEAWVGAGCLQSSGQNAQCLDLISLAFQALEQPHAGQHAPS